MLVIRREQMEALRAPRWREFAALATRHCRFRHPVECSQMTDEALESLVRAGLRRARSYHFDQSQDLMRFLDLLLTVGPDADQQPQIAAILAQKKYSPATRMNLIFRSLKEKPDELPAPPPRELPDVSWPEAAPLPVPPAPVLQPPGPSCMLRPPFDVCGGDGSC